MGHNKKTILSALISLSVASSYSLAADLNVSLQMQIELLPSCVVNRQYYNAGSSGVDFGRLDFGEVAAYQSITLNTSLINQNDNRISIQCSGVGDFKMLFGAGKNDNKVPVKQQGKFFRAMSNGRDYVAYNLLFGPNKLVQKPQSSVFLPSNNTQHSIELYAEAILDGKRITAGEYSDMISITIEF